jgi:hypothetical protein
VGENDRPVIDNRCISSAVAASYVGVKSLFFLASTPGVVSTVPAMHVTKERERLRALEAKLAIIEQDYHAELAKNEGDRELIDAKAEARALAAVFDFLRDCKISHTDSLLRILERYLRPKARFQTSTNSSRRRA